MKLTETQLKELLPGAKLDHRKKNLYARCPKCGFNEFGISLEENHRFGCFRKKDCGFNGNIFSLLSFLGKNIHDVDPTYQIRDTINIDEILHKEKGIEELEILIPVCKLPRGYERVFDHLYLTERGFTREDFERIEVGVTKRDSKLKDDYVIFPIRQKGEVVAYIGRSILSKKKIESLNNYYKMKGEDKKILRYRNSTSDFAKIVLGLDEITEKTDTIILVEGLFDKWNTDRQLHLRDQLETKCCATFKCGCSVEQMLLMQREGIKNVVLMYDNDVPEEIKKAASQLSNFFNTWVAFHAGEGDPGDMTIEQFDLALKNMRPASEFITKYAIVPKFKKK